MAAFVNNPLFSKVRSGPLFFRVAKLRRFRRFARPSPVFTPRSPRGGAEFFREAGICRLTSAIFPTKLLPTIVLENGMLNEASRNRASGVSALGLRVAPLRRAQRQPRTARTPFASDSAISGVNGGFARSSPAWGRACAMSSRGTRNRAVGRTYAATSQSRRQDILGGLVKRLRNLEPEFRKVMRKAARRMASQTKRSRSAKVKTGGVRKAKPRAHTERQRRVRGVRGQHDG